MWRILFSASTVGTTPLKKIKDDLTGMGFYKGEVERNVQLPFVEVQETFTIQTKEPPNIDTLNLILRAKVDVEELDEGYSVTFKDVDVNEKIDAYIDAASKREWQRRIFETPPSIRVVRDIRNRRYHPRSFYSGEYIFKKHFFAEIGAMNDEEIICAREIDRNKKVEAWGRNLDFDDE